MNGDKDPNEFDPAKGRKPNFFDRKRFLNLENEWDDDSKDDGAKDDKNKKNGLDTGVTKEIKDGAIV